MHGAMMASKRKRPRAVQEADPTPERLLKASGAVEYGDDGRGKRVLTVRDAPLERAFERGAITKGQYDAGAKYRLHWTKSGVDSLRAIDLNRVFGGDGALYGLPNTDAEHHRKQYRAATQAVGLFGAAMLEHAVCCELSLAAFGFEAGFRSESKAIEAAERVLAKHLETLRVLWGLT